MHFFLDGVPLKDPDGRWRVMMGTLITTPVTVRSSTLTVPGVSGVNRARLSPIEAPQMPIEIEVRGHNKDDMLANWSAISGLLKRAKELTRVPENVSQSTPVELVSIAEPEYNIIKHTLTSKALLRLNKAYWFGEESTFTHVGPSGTHTVTTLDGSTGVITELQIRIKGPANNPRVQYGDHWVQVSINLSGSEFLVIDCATFTARAGSSADWDGGGTPVVLETSGGPYALPIEPEMASTNPRDTVVRLALDAGGTSGATEFHVRGRPTYL